MLWAPWKGLLSGRHRACRTAGLFLNLSQVIQWPATQRDYWTKSYSNGACQPHNGTTGQKHTATEFVYCSEKPCSTVILKSIIASSIGLALSVAAQQFPSPGTHSRGRSPTEVTGSPSTQSCTCQIMLQVGRYISFTWSFSSVSPILLC